MSQKENSNEVLSWLERRKKKQLQSRQKKQAPSMLNGLMSTVNQSNEDDSTSITTRYHTNELIIKKSTLTLVQLTPTRVLCQSPCSISYIFV